MIDTNFRLTQFAHGAGCGCKISPQILSQILRQSKQGSQYPQLIVGNTGNEDAAVFDMGNGQALISTTDFFTPIVDDAFHFGQIAAANAISDVYAMGGKPMMALAILGWPVNKLPTELANNLMEGARLTCEKAKIPLAGGHSIDTTEPIFGLSVNGIIPTTNIKRNGSAKEGDWLLMTKPLGTGILSTAQKRGFLETEDYQTLIKLMTELNSVGEVLGTVASVNAMTDITGFGLLGHMLEMAEGSNLSIEVSYAAIPKLQALEKYLLKSCVPDATYRNWNAYQHQVLFDNEVNVAEAFSVLPDPQTNGGLLIAVSEAGLKQVQEHLVDVGYQTVIEPIGRFIRESEKRVRVKK